MSGEKVLNSQNKRNISLDVVRIIAMLSVVMIHCSAVFVVGFEDVTFSFMIGNIFDSLSRAGVPLFLMISGALLLNEEKEKSVGDMLNAAKNIVILLVLWSLIYSTVFNVISPIIKGNSINMVQFVKSALKGHYHMWYLYMLIGIYFVTPFLKKIVKRENKLLILFYIAVSLCTSFIKPVVNVLSLYFDGISNINTFIDKFYLDFFAGFVTYYLIGWYIVYIGVHRKWMRKLIYVLGGLSALIIITVTQITKDYNDMYSETSIFVFMYSISIFLFINNIKHTNDTCLTKPIILFSKLSFGIYIIHPMINTIAESLLETVTNPLLHIPLRFAFVVSASFFVCYTLSKIPYLKKLIRI